MRMRAAVESSREATVVSSYIAGALARELPPEVTAKTKHHVLDTLAAIVSGSRLTPGALASAYVNRLGGAGECLVIGTSLLVPAPLAALANGMAAHADETDDSHLGGRFHPGCAILPAALAVAEQQDLGGRELLAAVALGYDVGARLNMALGFASPNTARHSTHSLGAAFGAAAAAAALLRFEPEQVRHVLSYAAQQLSGVPFWNRDRHHVEKAFDFGGMGARNAVFSATMVAAGFSAVDDPFSGKYSVFTAFGETPQPHLIADGLGQRYEILKASIKKWCVGSPIQSVLDAVSALMETEGLRAEEVRSMRITLPDDRIHIIDNGAMPDVCVQHLAALALVDGGVTFESVHDRARMQDEAVLEVRRRITLIPSPELSAAVPARQAIVQVETARGLLRHHARAVRGTPDNPMSDEEVAAKALGLVAPIIGPERGERLVSTVQRLEELSSVRALREVLQV
jgi:2-methylcitrate dehydratase PrpD